jgi:transposase
MPRCFRLAAMVEQNNREGKMEQAIAGVDPHKLTVTVAVIDVLGVEIAALSFANSDAGLAEALTWLASLGVEVVRVGVEGSSGHGRHAAERLVAAGFDTREVPPRRTAERRRARRRAKSDHEDALAIARATAAEPTLGPVKPGSGLGTAHDELVAVRKHRDLLVQRRTMLLNHAEATLAALPRSLADLLPRGRGPTPAVRCATARRFR